MKDLTFLRDLKDGYKYNLKRRADGVSASRFEWNNPLDADGIPILARAKQTDIDPNIRVTHNLFEQIMQDKASYIAPNIEITFTDDINDDVKAKYEDFEKRNYLQTFFKNLMEDCAGWGNTYVLFYLGIDYKPEVKKIDPWSAYIDLETNNGYVIERDEKARKITVYEYDDTYCYTYHSDENFKSAMPQDTAPHGFRQMPLIEFRNNQSRRGNAEKAVSLIDAYDRIVADNLTEWSSLRQAYLLLKDMGEINTDVAKEFQKLAMLIGRDEHSDARFITKNLNPDFAKFITERTWSSIWSTASCPDPNVLESLSNVTAFQISQLYRRLDNNCKDTVNEWQKALQQFDEVLHSYWTGLDLSPVKDYNTWDVDYVFNKDIPIDVMTFLKDLKQAGGNLPQAEIFVKSGYTQEKAEELTEEYKAEQYEGLPEINETTF